MPCTDQPSPQNPSTLEQYKVLSRLEHAERVTLDQSGTSEDLAGVVRDLEAENGDEDLLQITALVVGITGTGKSASINSLLGYNAVSADAFNGTSKASTRAILGSGLSEIWISRNG